MPIAVASLTASQAEFDFEAGPHAAGELAVLAFDAEEEISRPFSLEVTVVPGREVEVSAAQLVGAKAVFTVQLGDGSARFVNGIVAGVQSWEEGHGEERRRHRIRVVPALWKLGHVRRSRIFQAMSVPEIVKKVLDEGRVKQRAALSGTYKPRVYCVQYDESDLDFVSRLLEEEGIFYFFEHEAAQHTLVLSDASDSCPPIEGEERIVFRERSGMAPGEEHVDEFSARVEVRPGKVSLRDYDELRPALDLTSSSSAGTGTELEVYQYPGRYLDGAAGRALAKIRLEEERVPADTASGSGFSRRLAAGHTFELDEHPIASLNAKYLLVSVKHRGDQPEVLGNGAPDTAGGESYRNHFTCIPQAVPYRTARRTERPLIPGPQTAIVVGPPGEEIHCDQHGRIKVQFHWDREGVKDEKSSAWIRVSQAWAGPGWGALYLPRIGQEVVVEFLEGDPDRPLITGAVYNGTNPPPLSLPSEKTKSTLRSASSPGSAGSNELRFEDQKGREEVFLHAQKDLDIVVRNDKTQRVGGSEQLSVGGSRSREIGGNQSLHVLKNDSALVDGNQKLHVKKDRSTKVAGRHSETIGKSQEITVGASLSVNIGATATEKVGGKKSVDVGSAYVVHVGGAMAESVLGDRSDTVGGARQELIGGKQSEKVKGKRELVVGGNLSETVGGGRSLKVKKDLEVTVGAKLAQVVGDVWALKAKEIAFTAEDNFVIKVGSATIAMAKDGSVVIKGMKIELKADGEIVLKGAKVSDN